MTEPRSSPAANLALAALSLLTFVAMAALVEGGLRLAGLGAPDPATASRLRYQHLVLPAFEPGVRPDGAPVLRSADPRLERQSLAQPKPEGSLRVVVLGGSAAAGLGFSPNAAFTRHLGRILERSQPRPVEAVNLGIVALSSSQVRILVDWATAALDPDLLIVYSGNNEFLETHARKYAEVHATLATRLRDRLADTHVYRLLARLLHREPTTPSASELTSDALRVTQREIVRDVQLEPDEVEAVLDVYEANLESMVETSEARGVPILLVTVASNWEWRGREDLPEGWIDELAPEGAGRARLEAALEAVAERLDASGRDERHEWLFRRAKLDEALGRFDAARRDYREAMNRDPHLRRALDTANRRLLAVAQRRDAAALDLVAALAADSPHGIVGFDAFYDYVHFTPAGAVRAAAAIARALDEQGMVEPGTGETAERYARERLAALAALERDPLDVREWLGFGFDRARIADRDLWKYDALRSELDARIAGDASDARALVYRGNLHFFRRDGAADAAADYRAAIDAGGPPEARRNLERLLADVEP